MSNPLVSICCITYNHADYIKKAIDSFLMQETTFDVEIIIHDDASTDGTADIIRCYETRYPGKISTICQTENQWSKGIKPSLTYVWPKARGKYIALCEGDDYWTDPLKLQKQVDFLEANPDVNIVHTDYDWLDDSTGLITPNFYQKNNIYFPVKYNLKEWYLNPKGRTLTCCFRKSALSGLAEIIDSTWTVGDTVLILYLLKDGGKVGFVNESTGVYRRNVGSASALLDAKKRFYYFENGSVRVKRFFYQYYSLNDKEIDAKIWSDYYEGAFRFALPAKEYLLFVKALLYKLTHFRLSFIDIKYIGFWLLKK